MARRAQEEEVLSHSDIRPLRLSHNSLSFSLSHDIRPLNFSHNDIRPLKFSHNDIRPLSFSHNDVRPLSLPCKDVPSPRLSHMSMCFLLFNLLMLFFNILDLVLWPSLLADAKNT